MVRFECDNCRRLKDDQPWILGFAAEQLGAVSARREVSIVSAWTREQAVEPLAVHFCSDECRAEFMQKLFGESASAVLTRKVERKKVIRSVPVETRVLRQSPGLKVETSRKVKVSSGAKRKTRRSA